MLSALSVAANDFSKYLETSAFLISFFFSSIEEVYFTRNKGIELCDIEIEKIVDHCQKNKMHFSYLLTPSKYARFQMKGWNPDNVNLERTLPNFIYEKWLKNWKRRN